MYFKTAVDLLGDCPIELIFQRVPEADFRFMQDPSIPAPDYSASVLYYCDYETLSKCHTFPHEGHSLLLYKNEEILDPLVLSGFSNVLATDRLDVFNFALILLHNGLQEESRLVQQNRILLDKIIWNKPLQEIVDQVASTYGHYTDILDNALNIIAVSSNYQPTDLNIAVEHSYQSIKPNVIQYLRTRGSLDRMRASKAPIYVEDPPRNTYVYSTPIYIGEALHVGFLSVFVEKDEQLSAVVKQYLQETTKLLSLVMQRNGVTNTNKATYFTHVLSNMLNNKVNTGSSYKEQFLAFNYHLKQYMQVAVIRIENAITVNTGVDNLCEILHPLFPNSVYVVLEDYIVFLLSEDTVTNLKEKTMLPEVLKQNLIKAGISSVFEDENQVGDHFKTAKAALELGSSFDAKSYIYYYDDYKIMDIIDNVSTQRNLNLICFQPLLKLLQTDDAESTMLLETLFVYINNQFSIQKTCELLFIHRNTLYYRLQKIRDIMGCDFMEYPNLVEIGVTIRILNYLNLLPFEFVE